MVGNAPFRAAASLYVRIEIGGRCLAWCNRQRFVTQCRRNHCSVTFVRVLWNKGCSLPSEPFWKFCVAAGHRYGISEEEYTLYGNHRIGNWCKGRWPMQSLGSIVLRGII